MDSTDREDWDERVPCPDGACTGVLDPDGVCGTCGKTFAPGTEASREAASAPALAEDAASASAGAVGDDDNGRALQNESAEIGDTSEEDDERVPCPDGACTGILGPSGACGTCGVRP